MESVKGGGEVVGVGWGVGIAEWGVVSAGMETSVCVWCGVWCVVCVACAVRCV